MISKEIKGAVVGFMMHLSKGMVDDDRWDWTMQTVDCDWKGYEQAYLDPTIPRTTLSVFMNTLNDDASNYEDAVFRALQYFRMLSSTPRYKPEVPFTYEEMEEPEWYIWG